MGLLMSDTMLIDPMLDDTAWLRASLGAWACGLDVASDRYECQKPGHVDRALPGGVYHPESAWCRPRSEPGAGHGELTGRPGDDGQVEVSGSPPGRGSRRRE
jgi:hypothetical protein